MQRRAQTEPSGRSFGQTHAVWVQLRICFHYLSVVVVESFVAASRQKLVAELDKIERIKFMAASNQLSQKGMRELQCVDTAHTAHTIKYDRVVHRHVLLSNNLQTFLTCDASDDACDHM